MKKIIKTIVLLQVILFIGSCNTDDDLSYSCNSGNCIEESDGAFATLAECQNACGIGTNGIVSNPGGGAIDADGHSYLTVVLGNGQEWMAENLRSATYCNGDPIPHIVDDNEWANLMNLEMDPDAWAHFINDIQYEIPYGKLYNWYAVDDPRNICPCGWHVPTDDEWAALTIYLGGDSLAGGKLKSTGTEYWQFPNVNATNEVGFSALPGGTRFFGGYYDPIGSIGHWWTFTETDTFGARSRYIRSTLEKVGTYDTDKRDGFSVRCLKD